MQLEQPNFFSLISDKTRDFVGREWVFEKIGDWLDQDNNDREKYFIITGKAGSGKSTIAARLIEISNGDPKINDKREDKETLSKVELVKDFLAASYVISFKDNLSTDAKTLAKSLSSQLASKFEEFKTELVNSIKTSNTYDIDIDTSQQQITANDVSGSNIIINIQGESTGLSVFNDLVRNPLQSFLKNNPAKKIIFLIDGLDESILSAKEESYTDSIISILSNLEGIDNIYFILTTRDHPNVLSKFRNSSTVLDISSKMNLDSINSDVLSFIKLNLNKNFTYDKGQEELIKKIVNELVTKVEGNFLYIKFVMDAIADGKIDLSLDEISSMPAGLYGMYELFFERIVTQVGKEFWKDYYTTVLKILLVSFEGIDLNQISFFTGIQRDKLQDILINLKPFTDVESTVQNEKKRLRYKLFHQSLAEFLKKEYFDDDSINGFFISEKDAHRNVVEKYYNVSDYELKINTLDNNEYGLRFLSEHLFALIDYDDPNRVDWYQKLLHLVKNKEFKQKQLDLFHSEPDLRLRAIRLVFEASLTKNDYVSTVEMLLMHQSTLKDVLSRSPLDTLIDYEATVNDSGDINSILSQSWKIANMYERNIRIIWYLLIAWYFHCKNKEQVAKKTLDLLISDGLDSFTDSHNIIKFLVYSLYNHYKEDISKLLRYFSNDDIYQIRSLFFENNDLKTGIEIFE